MAQSLIAEGKEIRQKAEEKKEKENAGTEKQNAKELENEGKDKKDARKSEKKASGEKRRAKDDNDFERHNRPTLEQYEKNKGKGAGKSM